MRKHAVFISYDGMTDPLGQSQVLPYLTGLVAEGFKISLISFEKQDRFQANGNFIQALCNENDIAWYPQNYTKRPPVLSTVFDIRKMRKVCRQINQNQPIDILHCRSYISALVGQKFSKQWNIPWIFDMRGFWADERVEGKIWSLSNPLYKLIYKFFKKKEKQYFIESSAIISLTYAGKSEILTWNLPKVNDAKITVIPCCVDLNKFDRNKLVLSEVQQLQEKLDLKNKKVIGYVGSIGTWYMLTEMLVAFKGFLANEPNLEFLFVSQEKEAFIKDQAQKTGIHPDKIKVVSALHHQVPQYISLFDYSIFYILPSFSKKASSPTKQGELMAMGIPIICNDGVGDTAMIVEKYNAGIVLNPNTSTQELKLQSLVNNFNQNAAIAGAKEFYSLEEGIKRYKSTYLNCLQIGK